MSKTTIPTGGITADAIDATLIADDAISEEHLDATAITGHTALAESPADTDEFLISDGGTLKRIDASYVGGGSWTLLETENTTSGATVDFTSMSSDYHTHVFVFDLVRTVVDDDNVRLMVFDGSDNNLQIYGAREYLLVGEDGSTSTGTNGSATTSPHNFTLFGGLGSGSNEGFSGLLYFTGVTDSNDATLFQGTTINFDHNNKYTRFFHHGRIANDVLAKIRFYGGGGNWEAGTIRLYGIK